jgi:predicted transcriptional regulator
MSDDDIERVRELAESVIRAAEQRQKAADDPAIDWTEYDRIAQDAVDQQEALVERVDARTLLALIDRLEAAERERDAFQALLREARHGLALACEIFDSQQGDDRLDAITRRIDDALAATEQTR